MHLYLQTQTIVNYSILSGLKENQITKLQYVQNSTAHLLTGLHKHDHIIRILRELHLLPVAQRTEYKILLLTFTSLLEGTLNSLPFDRDTNFKICHQRTPGTAKRCSENIWL